MNSYLGLPSLQLMSLFLCISSFLALFNLVILLKIKNVFFIICSTYKVPIHPSRHQVVMNLSTIKLDIQLRYFEFENSIINCLNLRGFKDQSQLWQIYIKTFFTYFKPMCLFYTASKHQRNRGFQTFPGGYRNKKLV